MECFSIIFRQYFHVIMIDRILEKNKNPLEPRKLAGDF